MTLYPGQLFACLRACVCVYLLLLQPELCQLCLVLTVQPLELLAALLQVVVLSDELGVVPPERLRLLLQLRLLSQDTAVQHAGGEEQEEQSNMHKRQKKGLFQKVTPRGTSFLSSMQEETFERALTLYKKRQQI